MVTAALAAAPGLDVNVDNDLIFELPGAGATLSGSGATPPRVGGYGMPDTGADHGLPDSGAELPASGATPRSGVHDADALPVSGALI